MQAQTAEVGRQAVQVRHAMMVSTGVHKGMLFSVAGFQAGAIEYAIVHGIALVQMAKGSFTWFTGSAGTVAPPPAWADYPESVDW